MKITYDFVKIEFEKAGFVLLEDHYENNYTKMKYVCKCGIENITTWQRFRTNRYNKDCCNFGYAKIDFETVNKYFENHGCTLLENAYISAHKSMQYKCVCKRTAMISWENFRTGHRCKECGIRRGEKNNMWNPDRETVKLNKIVKKKFYSMLRNTLKRTNSDKMCKSEEMLGFTANQLKIHLESHPNWDKLKDTRWSLDHIFPIKAFVDHKITDAKIINSLDNLQPLSYMENSANRI